MERVEYERMHGSRTVCGGTAACVACRSGAGQALAGSAAAGPLLDAGCGTGGMLLMLGPVRSGRSTLGLEYDAVAAGLASAKAGRPVAAGSVNEMPIGDGTLAGYLSLDVLCHGGVDPGSALKEAHRCRAGRHRGLQSAGVWLAAVGARQARCTMSAALLAARCGGCSIVTASVFEVELLEHAAVSP